MAYRAGGLLLQPGQQAGRGLARHMRLHAEARQVMRAAACSARPERAAPSRATARPGCGTGFSCAWHTWPLVLLTPDLPETGCFCT